MNRHKTLNAGQKRALLGGPKGKKGKRGLSKGNDGFQKGGFRPHQPDKGAGQDYTQNKSKGKKQKSPMKEDMAVPGNRTTGLPAIGLTSPGLQLLGGLARKLTLHGW